MGGVYYYHNLLKFICYLEYPSPLIDVRRVAEIDEKAFSIA